MARFADQIISLVGKQVRLGRGGPDERRGTLESVQDEYLTITSEDGRVHYPLHHLRSVTEIMGGSSEGGQDQEINGMSSITSGLSGDPLPPSFAELIGSFLGSKIQVYDHGPESAAGFVFEVGDDFVKLVTGPDEMVHYSFFHIRSVRLAKVKEQKDDSDGSGKKDGSGGKNRGKSGGSGSRSGGGRSDGGRSGDGRGGGGRSGGGRSGGGRSGGGRSGDGRGGDGRGGDGRGGDRRSGDGRGGGRGRGGRGQSGRDQSGRGRSGQGKSGGKSGKRN